MDYFDTLVMYLIRLTLKPSRGFLDIEKSVLLELKGVKVIRSYRDFFQLIRDFLRINDFVENKCIFQ